ncbi:pyruvate dehydrogenase [Paracoccus sp. R12_1]|uniref:biotin/lipoyl-containing protein n=1 Tax=unclassified Paracoccus (in: a-proteobacteria) TaxID=2688777 RepID=UPI001ADBE75C|nr:MULTISPECIES: biotin/lipoyl-containing protein [unclassified Paracoccus (in: a-proteobacteria)]MBO9455807.1 pyruvate dehydrogenase [Paracoccus sp. R12_2]MBO9487239.1 pyruvate dehydrogenase [Paracoccus sp. R12_1]
MPHDVTMPQLGMAQDAGKIVSWLKKPGDAVSRGDALFEVETDKATMEVEAQADGFLTGVRAEAGEDVPVGQIIARITDSADEPAGETEPKSDATQGASATAALPKGREVTMPQLGMAQDSGLLVNWQKAPGDQVAEDDVLFEVETDKSTMEVPAGAAGYLAATLAEAGETVPVGSAVAIISADRPDNPVSRSFQVGGDETPSAPAPKKAAEEKPSSPAAVTARASAQPRQDGRILASPKARRLAVERGLDLARLVDAGHPQPYHAADLDRLAALPLPAAASGPAVAAQRLTAELDEEGLTEFVSWARDLQGLADPDAILAGLAGACLPVSGTTVVAIQRLGVQRSYSVPAGPDLSQVVRSDDRPALLLRDLRDSRLRHVEMGAAEVPVVTITAAGCGLSITLECSSAQLDADDAINLLTEFAGRLEQPLRHLL